MKNILKSIAVLLVSITSSSYTMGDKSGFDAGMGIGLSGPSISVPRLGAQPKEQQAEHESRQLTRFEQGIVKKAIEKLESIFKEQETREEQFNLLTLPFELQEQVLARLTPSQLARLARVSPDFRNLVNSYRQQASVLDLSTNRITFPLLCKVAKLYPNIKSLIIYNIEWKKDSRSNPLSVNAVQKNLTSDFSNGPIGAVYLSEFWAKNIVNLFPNLTYIKLVNNALFVDGVKFLESWEKAKVDRKFERKDVF